MSAAAAASSTCFTLVTPRMGSVPFAMAQAAAIWAGLAPWRIFLPVAIGAGLGGVLGAKLLPVLPARAVNILFALLMLLAGVKALFAWHF